MNTLFFKNFLLLSFFFSALTTPLFAMDDLPPPSYDEVLSADKEAQRLAEAQELAAAVADVEPVAAAAGAQVPRRDLPKLFWDLKAQYKKAFYETEEALERSGMLSPDHQFYAKLDNIALRLLKDFIKKNNIKKEDDILDEDDSYGYNDMLWSSLL